MARPLRLEFAGAIYHLTARGNARQKIFFSDADRQLFLDTLAGVVFRYGWICHAYCLMANHYHLLVETPKPNLSLGMRQLNGTYTQAFNRRHRRVGHLFQRRFKAILVEKELPVGALPLHCAEPDAGQRECTDRHLEMEQLPGYGGIGFGPGVLGD
jgi:putative transposase